VAAVALLGCGFTEEQVAKQKEQERNARLSKFCGSQRTKLLSVAETALRCYSLGGKRLESAQLAKLEGLGYDMLDSYQAMYEYLYGGGHALDMATVAAYTGPRRSSADASLNNHMLRACIDYFIAIGGDGLAPVDALQAIRRPLEHCAAWDPPSN
jgi:hypothetical protein